MPAEGWAKRGTTLFDSFNRADAPKNYILPYQIEHYPGYQLRSLMRGNALEKQLSQNGTIRVNSIRAHANKGSTVEKTIVDRVLSSEQFVGRKVIDYNEFRKAVQDELITYDRVPDERWADYGMANLGYSKKGSYAELEKIAIEKYPDRFYKTKHGTEAYLIDKTTGKEAVYEDLYTLVGPPHLNTFTFESPRIPEGNAKHYSKSTLGHSRTYTTKDEPEVLHVMESQSDWAQSKVDGLSGQTEYLHDNYLQRQLQENLKYAAENGQTKMRYPTAETAAKIENYEQIVTETPEIRDITNRIDSIQREINFPDPDFFVEMSQDEIQAFQKEWFTYIESEEYQKLSKELEGLLDRRAELWKSAPQDYSAKHKTILKKYDTFPKQYKKLYKDAEVRTVTDSKGNTWYEVDVPKDYLNQSGGMPVIQVLIMLLI